MLIHAQWAWPVLNKKMGVKKGIMIPMIARIALVRRNNGDSMNYEQVLIMFAITKMSADATRRDP